MRTRMTGSDKMRAVLSAQVSRAFLLTKTYMEAGHTPGIRDLGSTISISIMLDSRTTLVATGPVLLFVSCTEYRPALPRSNDSVKLMLSSVFLCGATNWMPSPRDRKLLPKSQVFQKQVTERAIESRGRYGQKSQQAQHEGMKKSNRTPRLYTWFESRSGFWGGTVLYFNPRPVPLEAEKSKWTPHP